MNPFRNIRIFPKHGSTFARITWEMDPSFAAGNVYLAFSIDGVKGSWVQVEGAVAASSVGQIDDPGLTMTAGHQIGYYRLLLRNVAGDFKSNGVPIFGDLTSREYAIARGIIRREFTQMRATNGYPVWHCIPRDFGEPAGNVDPDIGVRAGIECGVTDPEEAAYGLPFKGGFFPPILTWMQPFSLDRFTIRDAQDETTPEVTDDTGARLLAFPRPIRGHMIVDPSTDRRYLVKDEIKPFFFRGIIPVAYEVALEFLPQGNARYKFPMPDVDMREYRNLKNWW